MVLSLFKCLLVFWFFFFWFARWNTEVSYWGRRETRPEVSQREHTWSLPRAGVALSSKQAS